MEGTSGLLFITKNILLQLAACHLAVSLIGKQVYRTLPTKIQYWRNFRAFFLIENKICFSWQLTPCRIAHRHANVSHTTNKKDNIGGTSGLFF